MSQKACPKKQGFTLMEIVVATTVFVVVVTSVLALFNYVLKINRRVQAVRQVAQGTRNFTEILSREIRNGKIDYNSPETACTASNYALAISQSLAIQSFNGDRLCFYLSKSEEGQLKLIKSKQAQASQEESINPPNFIVNPANFRFIVRPTTSPDGTGIQPFVTILAEFIVNSGSRDEVRIPYQTTISSDVYDITHQ